MQSEYSFRQVLLACLVMLCLNTVAYGDGRLLATGGATQIEGAAGGGIVPWAVLSGYGTRDELGGTASATQVRVSDYDYAQISAGFTLFNRLELTAARQSLDIGALTGALGFDPGMLKQDVFGAKLRLAGDVVYSGMPQVSAGLQYKRNRAFDIPQAVGALKDSDTDFYLAATKLFLGGAGGRNLLLNATVRATRANQLGLLGYGGDKQRSREWVAEVSVAVFLHKSLALGYEYREKPDNLSFAAEDAWQDLFVAWFPNKHLAVVGAYTRLGSIAGLDDQDGWYFSLQGSF